MYKEYPKLVRISQKAHTLLIKASSKRGISMARLLSDYILKDGDGNSFGNWLKTYSGEIEQNSLQIAKEGKRHKKGKKECLKCKNGTKKCRPQAISNKV